VITIEIPGTPRGKGRPRFARRGKHVATYTDDATSTAEATISWHAAQAMVGRELITGPVIAAIKLIMPAPKSWSEKKRNQAINGVIRHCGKPDLDNAAKLILDALNGVVYADDKQIHALIITKEYGAAPRTIIEII
jgi:Holliday junction resolvase RusA-like endonuclease